jgi:heme-degrading monooxygenase HmoA
MSYVVINAITVPPGQDDELARRFAGRAGMVEKAEGFERFELLRPADGRDQWLVMTTWGDEAAFKQWMSSQAFGRAHGSAGGSAQPVSTASEIWAFTVEQRAAAS